MKELKTLAQEAPKDILKRIDEKPEVKQNLIFKIQKYQDSRLFGEIVKVQLGFKQSFDQLNEKSSEELENMLSRIRIHLDNRNLDAFYERAAESAAYLYEGAVSTVYDIDGFADLLLDSDDFWSIYERFKIENNFPIVNPTVQLAFMIAQSTIMAHNLAVNQETKDRMSPPPPLETILEGIEEKSASASPTPPVPKEKASEPVGSVVEKPAELSIGNAL